MKGISYNYQFEDNDVIRIAPTRETVVYSLAVAATPWIMMGVFGAVITLKEKYDDYRKFGPAKKQ